MWIGRKSRMRMGRGSQTQGRRRRQPAARFLVSRRALLSPSRLPFPPSTGASQMDASLAGGMRALLPLSRALVRARRPPRASRCHMATTWGARRRHTRGCRGEPDAMVQKTPGRQGVAYGLNVHFLCKGSIPYMKQRKLQESNAKPMLHCFQPSHVNYDNHLLSGVH